MILSQDQRSEIAENGRRRPSSRLESSADSDSNSSDGEFVWRLESTILVHRSRRRTLPPDLLSLVFVRGTLRGSRQQASFRLVGFPDEFVDSFRSSLEKQQEEWKHWEGKWTYEDTDEFGAWFEFQLYWERRKRRKKKRRIDR